MSTVNHTFTCWEIPFLAMLAERRNCAKAPNGVKNRKHDPKQSDFEANYHGVFSEHATAKYLGLKVNMDVALCGDGGAYDLVYRGWQIECKAATGFREKSSDLVFDSLKHFRADMAVLGVIRTACRVELMGWCFKEEFVEKKFEKNYGYGMRVAVGQEVLRPMRELKEIEPKKAVDTH